MGILDDVRRAATEEPAADEPAAPVEPLPEELVEEAADVLLSLVKERLVKAAKEKHIKFDERQEGRLRKRTVRENFRYEAQVNVGFEVGRESSIPMSTDRILIGRTPRANLCKSFNRYIGIAVDEHNVAGFCRSSEHLEQVGSALLRKLRDEGVDADVKVGAAQKYNDWSEKYYSEPFILAVSRIPCDSEGNI